MQPRKKTDYIIIHCAATRPNQEVTIADVDRWHRKRSFFMVGYHYFIRRDGMIETGRELDQTGAHAKGYNHLSVAICLAGGVDDDLQTENNFLQPQWDSLKEILVELKELYPEAAIIGHRDLPGVTKDCPSFDVSTWLKENDLG